MAGGPTPFEQQAHRGNVYRHALDEFIQLIERRAPTLSDEAWTILDRALSDAFNMPR